MQHWQSKKKDNSAFAEVFSFETHLRRHTAFVIFQLKVGQRMDGLIMSVKQNICFWEIFFRQKKCTE